MKTREEMRALLDSHHQWPSHYTFKFIVPEAQVAEVAALFPGVELVTRPSSKGRFSSVSFSLEVASAEAVLLVYDRAKTVPNLIAL